MRVLGPKDDSKVFGYALLLSRGRSVLVADTTAHPRPDSAQLAEIAIHAGRRVRQLMGQEPRVAFVSYSTFGNPMRYVDQRMRDAVAILDARGVEFEYDGEMSAEVAL